MRNLDILIWIGTIATLAGLGGIIWCIFAARAARRAHLDDAALRARLQRIVTVNLGALMASLFGLALVIVGIAFGR